MKFPFSFLLERAIGILLPHHCIHCNDVGTPLCTHCAKLLSQPQPHTSPWIYSAFSYKDPVVKKIVHHLKRYPNEELFQCIASLLSQVVLEELSEKLLFGTFSSPILIPVPLHTRRFGERGYNQSALLAKALKQSLSQQAMNISYAEMLTKAIQTPKQALIHEKEKRLRSPIGSIMCKKSHKERIRGSHCILVDDVTTTGATLAECKRALLEAGAKRVIALTIAH